MGGWGDLERLPVYDFDVDTKIDGRYIDSPRNAQRLISAESADTPAFTADARDEDCSTANNRDMRTTRPTEDRMRVKSKIAGLIALLVLGHSAVVAAAGPGAGLGRALGRAGGQGNAASGLSRATQNASRGGSGMGRATQSLSRGGGSLNRATGMNRVAGAGRGPLGQRATAGTASSSIAGAERLPSDATAATHQQQLDIEARNRDHRLGQAEHLRGIAERNGNVQLDANADRMEAFANEHHEERVSFWQRFMGRSEETPVTPEVAGDASAIESVPQEARRTRPWWRSWWPAKD